MANFILANFIPFINQLCQVTETTQSRRIQVKLGAIGQIEKEESIRVQHKGVEHPCNFGRVAKFRNPCEILQGCEFSQGCKFSQPATPF